MSDVFGATVVLIPRPNDLPDVTDGGQHVTLAYFGDTPLPDDLYEELIIVVRELAQDTNFLASATKNLEYFGDGGDYVVLTLDDKRSSSLPALRRDLVSRLNSRLRKYFTEGDKWPNYRPHITLGQVSKGQDFVDMNKVPLELEFDQIAVWNGENRISFDMSGRELTHYGILMKSGRYPWGSGETPHQRNRDFMGYVDDLKRQGLSEKEIAQGLGVTTTDLRAAKSQAKNQMRREQQSTAQRLKDKGMSNVAIGQQMGLNESSVRALLNPGAQDRNDILVSVANRLKSEVDKQGSLDIGVGVENHIFVSKQRLDTAVNMLTNEGYGVFYIKVPQLGTTHETNMKVLAPPGMTFPELMKNKDNIGSITGYSEDNGRSFTDFKPPKNLNSKRILVRYGDEGGEDMDGVIQLRRGVKDTDLGKSNYAQVRISVDNKRYLKGMAMYADDIPDGYDVVFNTNKKSTGNKLDAMKKLNMTAEGKVDLDNPFGAVIKGQRGVLNIVNEEGDWGKWNKSLSSQMLSKQPVSLAKTQLDLKFKGTQQEFDEIMKLTNPSVRQKLLEAFADNADASSVHLKAAALPRQATHAILPMNSLKDTEIYAPNYRNGEKVVLVRYPHGGKFEIPELTVNNRNKEGKSILAAAKDAVGINSKVASRLSGADFDGDTVLVIPNNNRRVKNQPPLKGLEKFDPIRDYAPYDGMKTIDGGTWRAATKSVDYGGKTPSGRTKQLKMGDVSNLITDMTIRGANDSELARAVRHSMVVIDAEKHSLDWRRSAKENNISQLKADYQNGARSGASTLISRASSDVRVAERKNRSAAKGGPIDPKTGRREYELTNASYVDAKGNTILKTTKSKRMAETRDAFTLSSGQPIEIVYATHANRLKDIANQARKAAYETEKIPYSPSAKKVYSNEVASLNAKLNAAISNKPRERTAQVLANASFRQKMLANPGLDTSQIKKIKGMELERARKRAQAEKKLVTITPNEWKAIQAGAISNNMLSRILNNADLEQIRQLATPRTTTVLSTAALSRARALLDAGYTQADVADQLGISTSTLNKAFE